MGVRLIGRTLLGALAAVALVGVTGQAAWADDPGSPLRLPATLPVPVSQDPMSAVNRIVAEAQRRANERATVDPARAAKVGGAVDRDEASLASRSAAARARACMAADAAEDRAEARRDAVEDRIERQLQHESRRIDRIEDRIEARQEAVEDRIERRLMMARADVQRLSDQLAADACAT